MNLSAFASALPEAATEALPPEEGPLAASSEGIDADGIPIPARWLSSPKWHKLPVSTRRNLAEQEALRIEREANRRRPRFAHGSNYSTPYAMSLCRERGWRILQSEYRDRRGHLHDCPFGSDVVAMDSESRLIYVQAGCKGSRAEHWQRFMSRTDSLPIGARFLYWEFIREGDLTLEEEWTPDA